MGDKTVQLFSNSQINLASMQKEGRTLCAKRMKRFNKTVCLATIDVNQKSVSMFKKNVQASVQCHDEVGFPRKRRRREEKEGHDVERKNEQTSRDWQVPAKTFFLCRQREEDPGPCNGGQECAD